MSVDALDSSRTQRTLTGTARLLLALHIDGPLFIALCMVGAVGAIVLFSASGSSLNMLEAQLMRFGLGLTAMIMLAQVPPRIIRNVAPMAYVIGLIMLLLVMFTGDIAMGAQRWLDLGFVRFQPSELMKLAVPLACAWFLHERPLPPSLSSLLVLLLGIGIPTLLIAEQPDLGTSLLVAASGGMVVLLAGLQIRYILSVVGLLVPVAIVAWHFLLHDYQKQRVLTFLDPQSDPLGSGYHIIQSQIAIGSGGVFGKGYLNGSQVQLEFLPERSTDFIFAVVGEEWGLMGLVTVILLLMFVIGRSLYLAATAHDTFSRLASGSLALTFCVYVFVNTGMVTGLLPVVGVPLPFISYGGTAMVTLMAGFGILMSLCAKRKLVSR
ncbi:rod shape-determining protein RodA [Steroidobacter sp. S1-65]|uniref:Peptidoglycan glycosyltransferase MrdB n=1 Tax=Steroidobacter gossypii TaxID=2805490 RepID=A0ABS1X5I4_9GAMM|nr:rod shape-determining protein RodA [Steroidobacter gossypii]MBM0108489.1 rod shape-determining protein RodA [Steroidobacter gossypii]